jgi:hypothetical protein
MYQIATYHGHTNKEHKKETTSSMAPSTSGYLKTAQNAYDTGCWDVTDLRSNPQSISDFLLCRATVKLHKVTRPASDNQP